MPTRDEFIQSMRSFTGTRFGHQGREPKKTGLDCGGLVLVGGRKNRLTELEFLGYASFPTDGKFDQLLDEHTEFIGVFDWPFRFDGTELRPADLLSFDYGNGEGTKHLAMVTRWDG